MPAIHPEAHSEPTASDKGQSAHIRTSPLTMEPKTTNMSGQTGMNRERNQGQEAPPTQQSTLTIDPPSSSFIGQQSDPNHIFVDQSPHAGTEPVSHPIRSTSPIHAGNKNLLTFDSQNGIQHQDNPSDTSSRTIANNANGNSSTIHCNNTHLSSNNTFNIDNNINGNSDSSSSFKSAGCNEDHRQFTSQEPTSISTPEIAMPMAISPQSIFGRQALLEPESGSYPSFQSFFSLPSSPAERGISFEQMLMANSAVAAQGSTAKDHPLSTHPRSAARSPKPEQEATEIADEQPDSDLQDTRNTTGVDHDNYNNLLSPVSGYTSPPDSDPASIKTILSAAGHIPGTNLEDMEEECLDYRLKGRSRVSRGYSADFSTSHWTAGSNHSSPVLDGTFADRGSMDAARRSMSKSRMSALSRPSSPKMNSNNSSEMLPLSEFLSQPVDDAHVNLQPSASASRGMNSAIASPNYRRYSPPTTTPPPAMLPSNQTGRIPITTAAGEFSGFQQYTPRYKDAKDGDHSRMPNHERPITNHINTTGIGHLQETQLPSVDSGMAGNGQDHDEDEYLTQGKPIRNYRIFPGRNIFFCGGRIMTSRDFPAFIMAIMLILTPTGLFLGFTSPYLWRRLSPAASIVHAYLFVIAFSSMLKTSWTDPGVVPRGIDSDPPVDPPLELDPTSASFYPPRNLPRQKEVQIGNYTVRLKYCDTCKIYRPPRCSHCRQCDNCVEDEDHHCIWLNNCIGRRNYRYFLIFVTTASVYAFLTSALSLTHLLVLYHDRKGAVENPNSVSFQNDALAKAPVSALLMIYALIMGLAVGALAIYHFWLATKNRTTHEQLTSSMLRPHIVDNPFDRGSIFGNCAAVLCRPPTRSYIRRRDYTVA